MNVRMRQRRTVRKARQDSEHRWYDIAGVVLIAAGIIAILSLLLPDTGVVGGAAGRSLEMLFGQGA
ncbi:MAG: hypothetical protein H0W86_01865, partial [Armatimonadetes bacterium]|nr:hypothetical protein [Armatimonadota bacterium]